MSKTGGNDVVDPFYLQRFVDAQRSKFETARTELRDGEKKSHWMWFIFPQLRGLGYSETADFFGLSGIDEAVAYLQHDVLGARLVECTNIVCSLDGRSAEQIFSYPDHLKLCSSMTLFDAASQRPEFGKALEKYFDGQPDSKTLQLLGGEKAPGK